MTMHSYQFSDLAPDYLRAGAGFLLTGGPLLLVNPASVMVYILGGLAALFAIFGIRTGLRQVSKIHATPEDVRNVGPLGAVIPWSGLDMLELKYFSTQRNRKDGWMQLKLRGVGKVITVDSNISDFEQLATLCAAQAIDRDIALDEYSRANLQSLGITLGSGAVSPEPKD